MTMQAKIIVTMHGPGLYCEYMKVKHIEQIHAVAHCEGYCDTNLSDGFVITLPQLPEAKKPGTLTCVKMLLPPWWQIFALVLAVGISWDSWKLTSDPAKKGICLICLQYPSRNFIFDFHTGVALTLSVSWLSNGPQVLRWASQPSLPGQWGHVFDDFEAKNDWLVYGGVPWFTYWTYQNTQIMSGRLGFCGALPGSSSNSMDCPEDPESHPLLLPALEPRWIEISLISENTATTCAWRRQLEKYLIIPKHMSLSVKQCMHQ